LFNPGGEFSQTFDVYAPITNVEKRISTLDPAGVDVFISHNSPGCETPTETNVVANDRPEVVIQDVIFVLI
jgi:hypothetical protein